MSPANKIKINYDKAHDVLNVIHAEADPKATQNIDLDENIVIRYDPARRVVVGFIVDEFSRLFPDSERFSEWQWMEIFDFVLDIIFNDELAETQSVRISIAWLE